MKNINCNFCQSDKADFIYELRDRMIRRDDKRKFELYKCQKCGFAYLNPQPEWEDLKYFYGGDYYTNVSDAAKHNIFYRALRKIKRAIFGAYKPKFYNFGKSEGKFLDVGCGSGAYEFYLIKDNIGWEFYGVEPSAPSYQIAKAIEGFKVFNGDLRNARYSTNFFDVILMSHSLEHVSNPTEVIAECFRILKPGGRLVVSVPNFNSLARRFFGKYWLHLDAPRHLFHFTPDILKKMTEKSGFKIEKVNFEVLSGSMTKSAAYIFNKDKFFFDTPFVSLLIHYLIWPIDKFIQLTPLASGFKIIAIKA